MNVRVKGAAGEREAAKWLYNNLSLDEIPQRNLDQVREGGYDLTGCGPFAIEVKRCQVIKKRDWWLQVRTATPDKMCSVVMYRKNNSPWKFLIPARIIGLSVGFIQLEEMEFKAWASKMLQKI